MKIFRFIKNELLYAGLNKDEFQQVKDAVGERNRKSVIAWSGIVGLFWVASLFITYNAAEYEKGKIVFTCSIIYSLIALCSALFLIKRHRLLLFPTMYFLQLSVLGTGIAIAVVQPSLRTATMIATAMIVPTFFIDRTIALIFIEGASIIAYVFVGKIFIQPDVFKWGLETLITFSVAGIISGHTINRARFERFVYADSAKKLADIQQNYNEQLQKEVNAKTEQIIALHDNLVIGMATMIESRDNSTGGHIQRTSETVKLLTDAITECGGLELSDDFRRKLIKAAPMHDLGKIAVDDSVLRKPGRFTPEEYEKMRTHAAEGARIVHEILENTEDAEFRRIAENVAHYHHERFDGSGYPDKLKGEEIPLEARIMAIADVYDALVSKRAYKEKFSFEEADRIITDGMGTQFDPALKKYYEAARPRLEAYYKQREENESADK